MGVVKKVLFYSVIGLVTVIGIAVGLVYAYQDKIIELFVAEANKHIKTPVQVEKISLSLFDKFPQVTVSLDKVNVVEGVPESEASLAKADRLYFAFDVLDILRGKYTVDQFYMEGGHVYVKVLENGSVNYNIIHSDSTASTDQDFSFNLEKITLNKVTLHYTDLKLKQEYELDAHALEAALGITPTIIDVKAKGDATITTIKIGTEEYFKGKVVNLSSALQIDRENSVVTLKPSIVQVEKASYEVAGTIEYAGTTALDLQMEGKNTSIQSMLSLLPQSMTKAYSQYRSDGDVYFSGFVKGKVSEKNNPEVSFKFGCRNASFYHPDVKQRIEKLSFEGSFTNGTKQNASTSVLELKNLNGSLNKRAFSGNLLYRNFNNPFISFDARGTVDIAYALGLLKLPQVKSGSGVANVHIAFSGNFNEFKSKPGNNTMNTSGEITLHSVSLALTDLPLPIKNLNGNFMFKRNDVAVSDFKGKLGDSDFVLNGMFKNVMAFLLLDKQRLLVEADFNSNYLNLDQLLKEEYNTPTASRKSASGTAYRFNISPAIAFNMKASINKAHFRRFKAENIKGEVKLQNQVITSPNISFKAIGGNFAVRGILDARQNNNIKLSTASKLNNMNVDSLFYVFENFGQDFIVERHMKGKLTADILSDVYFDNQLNTKTDKLQAEIVATVRNGQLIDFAPMQKMSTFVKRSELANMHFAELHNSFWIQERTIYMPEMDIRSNISAAPVVSISGTHTFDQDMDYKIKLPLFYKSRPDKDSKYGVVASDPNASNSNLFLTLKGKESNFKLAYDDERVRQKIKSDLKQEGQELKNLLKGKGVQKKEKAVELEEGEYFEFDQE